MSRRNMSMALFRIARFRIARFDARFDWSSQSRFEIRRVPQSAPFSRGAPACGQVASYAPHWHLGCEAPRFSDWRVPPRAFGLAVAQRRERRKMWPHSSFVKLLEGGRTKSERRWDPGRLDLSFFEHVKPIGSGPDGHAARSVR